MAKATAEDWRARPDKVALVTGAGRGIGRAVALRLARAGYSLCLAARTRAELEETRRLSALPPARALIVLVDLAETDGPENLFGAACHHFGRLDVLVNNAGWAPVRTALAKTDAQTLDRLLAVNLRAPLELARLAAPAMAARGGGTIINIASLAARRPAAGEALYAAAKAGLVAFSHAAFAELRQAGVKVAVILPGLVDTALIPENRKLERRLMLSAEDVAEAVMTVVDSPARVCLLEVVLEPQSDPLGPRRR